LKEEGIRLAMEFASTVPVLLYNGVVGNCCRDMTMLTITLPPELEHALAEQARAQGTTPELLALDSLRKRFLPAPDGAPATGEGSLADFLAGYVGVLHSSEHIAGGARMSEECGKRFASGMLRKRQAGKL
jgi:hypothetical protein